jgi:hypothetical protein
MAGSGWQSIKKTMGGRAGRAVIGTIMLLLQACSTVDDTNSLRMVGDSGSVVVMGAGGEERALPFASRHCATYGKLAEFKAMTSHRISRYASEKDAEFNCVRPSTPSARFPASGSSRT